jgi:hypothetical protein
LTGDLAGRLRGHPNYQLRYTAGAKPPTSLMNFRSGICVSYFIPYPRKREKDKNLSPLNADSRFDIHLGACLRIIFNCNFHIPAAKDSSIVDILSLSMPPHSSSFSLEI